MHGHRIGYVRVSSFEQNPERQLKQVPVDRLFTDKASGKDRQRPKLERLLAFARQGDTVVVHSMERLAPAKRVSLLAFPTTYDELIRHYTFSEFDLASIQQGTVTASLMLRKLGSYPRHSSLALALRELEVATSFRCSAMDYLLLRTSMSSSDTFREVRFIELPPRLLKFVFTDLRLT